MNFFIIVIFICLFISLFALYFFSKDDLTLLRKDISMDRLFNLAFLDFIVGLFFARFVFVLFNFPWMFLNPLVFFLFPYFPGLSLIGGLMGGIIFLIFYSRGKNLPSGRIIDFFSISFLASLPFGYLGYFILSRASNIFSIILAVVYALVFFVFIKYLYRLFLKSFLRDGSLSLIFFGLFSAITVAFKIIEGFANLAFIKQPENYLLIIFLLVCLIFFIKQEKIIKTRKR